VNYERLLDWLLGAVIVLGVLLGLYLFTILVFGLWPLAAAAPRSGLSTECGRLRSYSNSEGCFSSGLVAINSS